VPGRWLRNQTCQCQNRTPRSGASPFVDIFSGGGSAESILSSSDSGPERGFCHDADRRGRRECVRDTRKPEGKRVFVPSVVQQGKSQGKANTVKGSETGDDETIASVAKP
jgi:hypothetical protein